MFAFRPPLPCRPAIPVTTCAQFRCRIHGSRCRPTFPDEGLANRDVSPPSPLHNPCLPNLAMASLNPFPTGLQVSICDNCGSAVAAARVPPTGAFRNPFPRHDFSRSREDARAAGSSGSPAAGKARAAAPSAGFRIDSQRRPCRSRNHFSFYIRDMHAISDSRQNAAGGATRLRSSLHLPPQARGTFANSAPPQAFPLTNR